jgi:hypothetical protein
MHLYLDLKAFKNSLLGFCLLLTAFGRAQQTEDVKPYTLLRTKVVCYSDFGFNTAPFRLRFENRQQEKMKLRYRNNLSAVWGFGISYKWFALRLAFAVPGNLRPVKKFGKTDYFDFGFDFTIRKMFFDVDFHNYDGYAIKNAYHWNDTLSKKSPHDIRFATNAASFSINSWYFHSRDLKIQALRGKTGYYNKEVKTWYLKGTINIHGVSNDPNSLIPDMLIDSMNSKTGTTSLKAFDFGVIPGYVYVNRYKNWQYSAMIGFGPVIQSKFYNVNGNPRGILGLAPRYDIRFIAGYNVPRWFVMFVTDFDNKSIRINDLRYRQSYYSLKLVAGIRLDTREKEKKSKRKRD